MSIDSNPEAREFMNKNVMVIQDDFSIQSTIEMLKTHRISGAPVVDTQGKIVGIISEYDLLLQAASKDLKEKIEFNRDIKTILPTTRLKEVLVFFYKNKIRRLPVVDQNKKVRGIISRIDVLAAILKMSKDKKT